MTVKKLANKTAKKFPLPRSLKKLYPNVEHAVDASKPIEILVDADDCKKAERLNPTECALARAAKRELKADGVIIGMQSSYIIKGNVAVRFATPESVRREIVSFDRHQDFAPGEYYLTPKSPSMKLGKNYHPDRNYKGGKIKDARRKHHMSARVRILPSGSE
jgi:hypothetical protein